MDKQMIGGSVLTNWLGILGLIVLMYLAWRVISAFQRRGSLHQKAAAAPSASDPVLAPAPLGPLALPNEDIAVVAAAVYAMLGARRIVHLEPVLPGRAWETEGRWAQQTSHTPR
jgi:hypothetical protein